MKKLIVIALVLTVISLVFTGCKMGPEDPFFSFQSRLGRLTGKWHVTSYLIDNKEQVDRTDTATAAGFCGQAFHTYDTVTTITFIFYDDGRYENRWSTKFSDYMDDPDPAPHCDTTVTKIATSDFGGYWMWGGNMGDYKKKQELLMGDYGHDGAMVWDIIRLSGKQMKWKRSTTDSNDKVTIYQMVMEAVKD